MGNSHNNIFPSHFKEFIEALNNNGIQINVVSLEDLILRKKAAVKNRNKSRDSEDLAFLQMLKHRTNNG